MAGASGCVEAMWVVRRRCGLRQKADEVAAVAGTGGGSQQVAVRVERAESVLRRRGWLVTRPWTVVDGMECERGRIVSAGGSGVDGR